MPNAVDPLYHYLVSTPGLHKIGLLFGTQLYEVRFDERGLPVGGDICLKVLQMKLAAATVSDGIVVILSEGPLRLLAGRDEQGNPVFRSRLHMKAMAARHEVWFGLPRAELLEAFEMDRRLKIIARPDECHRIESCDGLVGTWMLPDPKRTTG